MLMKKFDKEFYKLTRGVLKNEHFKKSRSIRHHIKSNTFDHSVKVAYLCYLHQKRFKSKIDINALLRGALLHDFYLYERSKHSKNRRLHGVRHPNIALKNANLYFSDLSPIEADIISRHMFPLTPIPPKTREGWLVCFYDKVATVSDLFSIKKK